MSVPGSCRAFLELMQRARRRDRRRRLQAGAAERRDWLAADQSRAAALRHRELQRPTTPIHPAAAIAALRKVFPRDGIVLVDSGAHRAFAGHYWTAYEPRTYISATNLGPMGWAIPAAVGVHARGPTGASP